MLVREASSAARASWSCRVEVEEGEMRGGVEGVVPLVVLVVVGGEGRDLVDGMEGGACGGEVDSVGREASGGREEGGGVEVERESIVSIR